MIGDLRAHEMGFNLRHPIFGTGELTPVGTAAAAKYIRKAISHIIPRNLIISDIMGGMGYPGIIPVSSNIIYFDDTLNPYAYDLDLALDYMELAGYDVRIPTPTPTETYTHTGPPYSYTIELDTETKINISILVLSSIHNNHALLHSLTS